jgi:hypothetical protein
MRYWERDPQLWTLQDMRTVGPDSSVGTFHAIRLR